MSAFPSLEKSLDGVFVKQAPALPAGSKKLLVEWLPWINLILGVLTLWVAYLLWHWAHTVNGLINYANNLSATDGGPVIDNNRMDVGVWLALILLTIEALIYIAAFPATRARKKSGWDLMFYALLINVVYGLVVLFTDYGGLSSFIGSLIGSAIGLYLLFQIRSSYSKSPARKPVK